MSLISRYYTKQNIQNKLNEAAEENYNENISEIMNNMDRNFAVYETEKELARCSGFFGL